MKTISFSQLPDFAIVLDGRRNLASALLTARNLICREPFSCIVIIRDKTTLAETHARCKETLRTLDPERENFVILPDGTFGKTEFNRVGSKFSAAVLREMIGPDYSDLLTLAPRFFPTLDGIALRNDDLRNKSFHIDFNSAAFSGPLPGGVTVTLSVRGGGTVVVACTAQDMRRQRGVWEMPLGDSMFEDREQWQVDEGDICIMRAKDWPVAHLPCVHKSPARQRPGNSDERVVGVMLS